MCFFVFPREGGRFAPNLCTIQYLGCRDVTTQMASQGTRMPDPFVIQTCKPGKSKTISENARVQRSVPSWSIYCYNVTDNFRTGRQAGGGRAGRQAG